MFADFRPFQGVHGAVGRFFHGPHPPLQRSEADQERESVNGVRPPKVVGAVRHLVSPNTSVWCVADAPNTTAVFFVFGTQPCV